MDASRRILTPNRRLRWWPAGLAAAVLALGPGCAGTNKWWSSDPDPRPRAMSPTGNDQPQSAAAAAATTTSAVADLPLSPGKKDKVSKDPCVTVATAWRNYIEKLPDPAHDYRDVPGIAGQIFLFDKKDLPTEAEGSVTVDLYDETPRPPGQQGLVPERYVFTKEVMKTLKCHDERFGRCYQLFLPWPTFRYDVTQVRISVHYDVDGRRVIAPDSKFQLHSDLEKASGLMGNTSPWAQGLSQPGFPTGGPWTASANNLGWGSYGSGTAATGMGSLNPASQYANALSGPAPLGVVGGRPSGIPAGMGPGLDASPAMPITGAPLSSVPMSAMPSSGFGSAGFAPGGR